MPDTEITNAIITEATISSADHGILAASLRLDFAGFVQGFGGYQLYAPQTSSANRDIGGQWIWRVLQTVGTTAWSTLPGKAIRVKRNGGLITAIGHITKDNWFCPKEEFSHA